MSRRTSRQSPGKAAALRSAAGNGLQTNRRATRDTLENLVAGLGDHRDKMSYGRYTMRRVIDKIELEALYRTNWLARKVVDIPATDMTRAWVTFSTSLDSEMVKEVEDLAKRLRVQAKVRDSIAWGRLYGGAVLFLNIKGQDPTEPLDPRSIRKGQGVSLHVLDRWRATREGGDIDMDPLSEAFGQPKLYRIASSTVTVHRSRMIPFNGAELPWDPFKQNAYWHDSVLQAMYDSLSRYDTASQGSASMFFEAVVDVLKVSGLRDMLSTDDGTNVVTKRFQLASMMKSFNRMLLLDSEDDYQQKTNTFAGIKDTIEQFMMDVSGAADIPATRLFGQSPKGMNATGESDIRNYYDRISGQQEDELRPPITTLYEVLFRARLGMYPDDLEMSFPPLWQIGETEKAALEKTRAERDQIYLGLGLVPDEVVVGELLEQGTYGKLSEKDVERARELAGVPETLNVDPAGTSEEPGAPDQGQAAEASETEPTGGGGVPG